MKKIVFFNIPAHGHVNPTLGIVKYLTDHGHELVYFCGDEFQGKIEAAGAEFRSYAIPDFSGKTGPDIINLAKLLARYSLILLPELINFVNKYKPNIIVHDAQCLWGSLTGEITGIKTIASFTTFVFNNTVIKKGRLTIVKTILSALKIFGILDIKSNLHKIQKRYGIKKRSAASVISSTGNENIVYTLKSLQPAGDFLTSDFHFTGPIRTKRKESLPDSMRKADKPLIYISMGTIAGDSLSFFGKIIKAFRKQNMEVIIAAPALQDIKALGEIPENIQVVPFAPQLQILKQADLFITHGGMNSVHESLSEAVPMIIIPWQQEQAIVASRVRKQNCGVVINRKRLTPQKIIRTVHSVINNTGMKRNCIRLKEELNSSGGLRNASEIIIESLEKERP